MKIGYFFLSVTLSDSVDLRGLIQKYLDASDMSIMAMVDASQKGFIDRNDFQQMFSASGISTDRAARIFELLDSDSDGRISYLQLLRVTSSCITPSV